MYTEFSAERQDSHSSRAFSPLSAATVVSSENSMDTAEASAR
jgi:hypothetical protein